MPAERHPTITVVDDEPAVLAAVARDLRRGFGDRYRILRAGSGPEALDLLREVRARGDQVALLIADQRMPGMAGTDYLVEARMIFPDAKRALLTAYADTEAAIAAINDVSLDYYLLKPWDPPEEELFPVVEDLLTTWEAGAALESGGVRVIGHRFSKDSHELRDFIARNRVPARWLDVERDGEARELLAVFDVGADRLPVVLLEDGAVLERPTVLELAERLGVSAQPIEEHYDLVIVGGGPPGLAAAVYGASEGLRTVMVESEAPGGQAGQSSNIENYLGFPTGVSGSDLARRATDQARRLGAELVSVQDAVALRPEGAGRFVELSGRATQVTMLVRGPSLQASMSHYLVERLEQLANVDVRTQTQAVGADGNGHLRALRVRGPDGDEAEIGADACFVFIGASPRTDWLSGVVARDERGFILAGPDVPAEGWPLRRDPYVLETSVPGVFVAGDVRARSVKRVASAVGEGSMAVSLIHQYLADT